jgi:tetratricopeptide (TPR) repeat protein
MRYLWAVIALAGGSGVCASPAAAQIPPQQQPPPPVPAQPGESSSDASSPAPPPAPPAGKSKPKKNADSAVHSAPDQPVWDPQRAEKDIEVGKYYVKKGDIDAAIDRFEDATIAKPGYAIPYRYLGEAYEKKGKKKPAAKAYEKYLDLYPHAEDGEKIRKKIEKLHEEIDKEKSQRQ